MASDASDSEQLPSVDDQLSQAINILWLCSKADETSLDCEEFDLTYPLWAAVSLLEDVTEELSSENGHQRKVIQAECIVKAVAMTLEIRSDERMGEHGFDASWPLFAAIDLIQDVIDGRPRKNGKKSSPNKKREIPTVDPDHARAFHRLLSAAGKLPVAELERLARYAEIELADGKKPKAGASA